MSDIMLSVHNLHKSYGGIKAVDGASFAIQKGFIVALIGANGAGKSTVFGIITGFVEQDQGTVVLENKDISSLESFERARLGMATTFQKIRLFPKMTVMENVLAGMPDQNEKFLHAVIKKRVWRRNELALHQKVKEWLSFVGIDAKSNELAENLSFGQQKLLEIARALASSPKILLLDEPASGVNPTMLLTIKKLIKKTNETGTTILFIEHNMEFVMEVAQKIIVLDQGKEIASGTPAQIRNNPAVIDAYLGKVEMC